MKRAGIIIMVLGVVLTLFTAITFFTRKKVVDIGSLKITSSQPHHISWSPIIGIAVIAVGGVITLVSKK
jgi:hypothetical protein